MYIYLHIYVHIYVHIFIIISNSIISKINKMKRRKGKDLLFLIIIYVRNKRGNSCKSKHFSELITKYRYLNDIELFIV